MPLVLTISLQSNVPQQNPLPVKCAWTQRSTLIVIHVLCLKKNPLTTLYHLPHQHIHQISTTMPKLLTKQLRNCPKHRLPTYLNSSMPTVSSGDSQLTWTSPILKSLVPFPK